ncbi:MAG: ABC transporter permease [Arthrobacter sp.]|uniref:ABC transporter permease n=1 Tax=Arthrobacter TaxID=1663 RepID=UPI0026571378|nr:ABC transporter permease [Micrococcaceae bacterium]MDN5812321.1 ABC transporter permease [Micrococcaceae bacterium]MDN5823598.1 ABC transporter permease [Micrococcaceae bacterium]MDN5878410.1 ABC transporter permease [Micrococcaceae bacterium]MDN5887558.1 ABC transporter permease [Micrococcaceae bacterium]
MPENTQNRPTVRGAKISKYPIEHFVADPDETPLQATDSSVSDAAPVSLWLEAWRNLRTQPLFIISAILIVSVVFVALFPGLFTNEQPNANCQLANSDGGAVPGHPLGFTQQGCDILARVMYGTQSSLTIGLFATIAIVIFGGTIGAISGFFGGWVDAVLARLGDIFFALPLILGAIVVVQIPFFQENRNVWTIVLILSAFGWPQIARITRAAVIEVRDADFVIAARSLGVSRAGALIRHVIPNSLAPVIVIATITLGIFIVAESTLSYLGIGLPPDVMSWGNDIFSAKSSLRSNPMALFWPALALSLTVLSFIMLGDALQDALDPKARKR